MECEAIPITSVKTKYVQHTCKYLVTLNAQYQMPFDPTTSERARQLLIHENKCEQV